jgi:hypothetical protein
MNEDVLMFAAMVTGAVLIAGHVSRILRTRFMHRTLRDAISRDGVISPALLDRLDDQQPDGGGDDRNGLVLLALGAAMIGYGLIADAGLLRQLTGMALFPIFVGAVLLARALRLNRRAGPRS